LFEGTQEKNIIQIKKFCEALKKSSGIDHHFDYPKDGKIFDNLEIITENGRRYSFLRDWPKALNLRDLKINRWSKLKYKFTKLNVDQKLAAFDGA